jgi:hypothetical protein
VNETKDDDGWVILSLGSDLPKIGVPIEVIDVNGKLSKSSLYMTGENTFIFLNVHGYTPIVKWRQFKKRKVRIHFAKEIDELKEAISVPNTVHLNIGEIQSNIVIGSGVNGNFIQLSDNKIMYKDVDITEGFIKLISSGYLDRLLDNLDEKLTDEDRIDCLQTMIKVLQEENKESTHLAFFKKKPFREQIDDFINEQLGGIQEKHD